MSRPPAPQSGGSTDFDALWAELANWPGWYVTEATSASGVGSWGPADEKPEADSGWFCFTSSGSWCVTAQDDAWERDRGRYFAWGSSIRDAAENLASQMARVRTSPHTVALGADHYHEIHRDASIFRAACPACVTEAQACEQVAS